MNEAKRRAVRQIRAVEAFLREWDPIGVIEDLVADGLPPSEYDGYAPHIVGMLQRGATREDLAAHLRHCRTNAIGLGRNDAADSAIANRIFEWWGKGGSMAGRRETTVDPAIQIVEDVAGDGTVVQRGEIVSLDLQITLNRGDVVHPRQHTTVRVGDRRVFPGLSKSIEGMRRGGYRKTRVSPHLAYGIEGIAGKIPPEAVLICEIWLRNSRTSHAPVV